MEKQLHYEIHDHVVSPELHRKVWNYIQGLEHYAMLKDASDPKDRTIIHYIPKENKQEYYNKENNAYNGSSSNSETQYGRLPTSDSYL